MAIENTLPLPLEVILPVIAAIAAFAVAAGYTGWVAKQKPGTKEMLDIIDLELRDLVSSFGYSGDEISENSGQITVNRYIKEEDIAIGITTSGRSKNVLKALERSKKIGMKTAFNVIMI